MNIFITGAEGFIGRNLVSFLLEHSNHNIYYCDNSKFSIPLIPNSNRLTKICEDISEIQLENFIDIDVLIHLAAIKKHNSSFENEFDLFETNFIETRRIFNLAIQSNIKQIIFSSSLYASGNLKKLNFSENDLPIPSTIYGSSKFFGESCLRELAKIKDLSLIVFRLYFIYGPHQYYGKGYPSVFISTLNALKNNQSPIIFNDGKQKLDYLFVDDLSSLFMKSLSSQIKGFNLFNASSSNAYEIRYIVEFLTNLWNRKFNTSFLPVYKGEDFTKETFRSGSNLLAKKYFDWEPSIKIDKGLTIFFDWYISEYVNSNQVR